MSGQTSSSEGQGSYDRLNQTNTENEEILKTEQVQIERKRIVCTLKQNRRGRYLRISEEIGSHRNTIIIPATPDGIERGCTKRRCLQPKIRVKKAL